MKLFKSFRFQIFKWRLIIVHRHSEIFLRVSNEIQTIIILEKGFITICCFLILPLDRQNVFLYDCYKYFPWSFIVNPADYPGKNVVHYRCYSFLTNTKFKDRFVQTREYRKRTIYFTFIRVFHYSFAPNYSAICNGLNYNSMWAFLGRNNTKMKTEIHLIFCCELLKFLMSLGRLLGLEKAVLNKQLFLLARFATLFNTFGVSHKKRILFR